MPSNTRLTPAPHFTVRKFVAVLRLAVACLIAVAIVTQITDEVVHGVFVAGEYFSYFTIESSLMNVVALAVGAVIGFRRSEDTELFTSVRVAIVAYAVVTGVVYNVLLRNLPSDGGLQAPHWPTEVMHVWVPIFIVLDWLLAPGAARVGWSRLWLVVCYPLAWLTFTLVRGGITRWYPYPFLEPAGPGGIGSVIVYVAAIAVFIVLIAAIAIMLARLRASRR